MTTNGVDTAGRASGADLQAAGQQFVVRYLSRFTEKVITRAEAEDLQAHGIQIVSVFEDGAMRMLDGRQAGTDDGLFAYQQGAAAGLPAGAPIYFAADFDASATQQAQINAYLQGAAAVLGVQRVGIYGGYWTVSRALNAGVAAYAWQTTAWSGGQWDPRAVLRQTGSTLQLGGVEYDQDQALAVDYGQWQPVPVAPPWPGRILKLTQPEMHGNDVEEWQAQMAHRGWSLAVDGVYGPATRGVCEKFQAEKHLTVDGEVGPITWAAAWLTPVTP